MVNFETDTIVQVNPRQTITLIYLQRSEELAAAWKDYYIIVGQNKNPRQAIYNIKAALKVFFNRLEASIFKSTKPDQYETLKAWVESNNLEDLEKASLHLERYLYEKNITRIDSSKNYDSKDIEADNAAYGL